MFVPKIMHNIHVGKDTCNMIYIQKKKKKTRQQEQNSLNYIPKT